MLTLVHGSDVALCDERVAALVATAQQADPGVEVSRYDGEQVGIHELVSAITSLSLFATARVVIIGDLATRLSKDKALAETVTSALTRIPPGIDVIFRERREVSASEALTVAVREAGGTLAACPRLQERDFERKLRDVARERRIRIDDDALSLLKDRCKSEYEVNGRTNIGHDLLRGHLELEKLAAYLGGERPIARADVDALVEEPDQRVFDYTDALSIRRLDQASATLEHLLDKGDVPQVIFALVVRQIRLLMLYVAGQQERGDTSFLRGGEFHLRDFQLDKLQSQAGNFSLARLYDLYDMLVRADEAIKTGKLDAKEALWLFTESACTGSDLLPQGTSLQPLP